MYAFITDFDRHHVNFLPPAFSEVQVETGGVGEGTVLRFKLKAGGTIRGYRSRVAEPEPGRVMTETDLVSGHVTTLTVTPTDGGSWVEIERRWQAAGLTGLSEWLCAPRMLSKIYRAEPARLERYAQQRAGLAV